MKGNMRGWIVSAVVLAVMAAVCTGAVLAHPAVGA
jgi:hypothetical protein